MGNNKMHTRFYDQRINDCWPTSIHITKVANQKTVIKACSIRDVWLNNHALVVDMRLLEAKMETTVLRDYSRTFEINGNLIFLLLNVFSKDTKQILTHTTTTFCRAMCNNLKQSVTVVEFEWAQSKWSFRRIETVLKKSSKKWAQALAPIINYRSRIII